MTQITRVPPDAALIGRDKLPPHSPIRCGPNGAVEPLAIAALRTTNPESHVRRRVTATHPTVLLVTSDEAGFRTAVDRALPGYQVVVAPGAYEAIVKMNAQAFDLYVLDYWLPDWFGVSLCRDIRKRDPHVPICVCGHAEEAEKQQRAHRAGANAYFRKPVDTHLMKSEVSRLMQLAARRNKSAQDAASVALQKEIQRRYEALPSGSSCDQVERALERVARTIARTAFLGSGGTLGAFERLWRTLWVSAWGTIKNPA